MGGVAQNGASPMGPPQAIGGQPLGPVNPQVSGGSKGGAMNSPSPSAIAVNTPQSAGGKGGSVGTNGYGR